MRWIKSNLRFLTVALVSRQSRIRKILHISTCIKHGCITSFRPKLFQGHLNSICLCPDQKRFVREMVCACLPFVFVNVQCVIVQAKITVLYLMFSSFTAQVICVISVLILTRSHLNNKTTGTVQTESEAEMFASLRIREIILKLSAQWPGLWIAKQIW